MFPYHHHTICDQIKQEATSDDSATADGTHAVLKKKACGTRVGESEETVIKDVLFGGGSEELALEVMGQVYKFYIF